jgi:hypothetical protein
VSVEERHDDESGDAVVGRGRAGGADRDDGDGDGGVGSPVDHEHRAAVRTLGLVVVAVGLVALAGISVVLARSLDDGDGSGDDPAQAVGGTSGAGPAAGEPVAAYVADRTATLAEADGRRVAAVSLTSYRPETSVTELVEGIRGVQVLARLAAVPGGPPEVVTEAWPSWVVAERADLHAERDEIAGLLPTIEDPDDPFVAGYTEDLARLDAQLARLDPAGDLVYGVVVRGDADALRRLAERPEVRLVDLIDDRDDLSTVRALRPEERETAGTPPTRPT